MELPLGGPALRHYTQSRPRPHRQKLNYRPSRPQETIIESENETLELMGRVDEGVEEFFTKKVLPTEILKKEDEESITVQEVAPASSVPCPPPTKTLRRKLGDFFTLKKRRGLKAEASQEGRPKKASIADLIRPLREAARAEKEKDKERVKEHDKENEKEKAKEHPSAVTGDSAAEETPVSGAPPLRGEAAPPRRALREGKSQSLILLSGSGAAGTANARNTAKKQFEGQHSFEQKLHLMLQRIGVSKPQPGETQNQEGEMKKADSEGTIIDSKPEPPASFSKPRTMSASSDTRHQIRPSVSAHESAGKPALLPKPVIKPAPPPATSGRNTPENELGQIQEGETGTPTRPGPPAAASPAAAPTTTSTIPTISNSTPDSAAITVSPSSTVTPSDTDICTDSVNSTAAPTTPADVTEVDSKASEGSTATAELSTAIILTAITSTSAPTEPPAAISLTSTSSVVITPTPSLTSTAITTTTPSVTTLENVSAPSNESLVTTISPHLPTKSSLPEPGGIQSADATPADGGDATVSSPSTSVSDKSPGLSTTARPVTGACDDAKLVTSALETLASPISITTSPPSDSADTTAAAVPPDTPITSSSILISAAPPPPSTTTTATGSPTTTDSINAISASTISHPASDFSAPATSSSETTPTGTTSTTISLNHADTTSTTSSSTTAAVSATLSADSVPALTGNLDATLTTPTLPGLPVTDSSSVPSPDLTSPIRSDHSPGQENDSETSPAERSGAEPLEKDKADEELERLQTGKQSEMDESLGAVDDGKRNEKAILVSGEETKEEEVQEESERAEEDATPEPLSRKEGERSDEGGAKGQKQEGAKSVSEK